ncbi:MAG: universal stress protein [Acidimicrobiales bacterium]|nr:universal stress protein [Acidimicrobiales bacterium]
MTVVVGVDESDHAREALRWGVAEASAHGRDVRAVLAWSYLDQHGPDGEVAFRADYGQADAEAALDGIVDATVADAAVERVAVNDLPARALLEAGADADLLVVGARGLGRLKGTVLGSVSQQVVDHAPVPVAIIRAGGGGATGGPVVVGVDGSDNSVAALAFALEEGRAHGVGVTVVHASRLDPDPDLIGAALDRCDTEGVAVDAVVVEETPATALLDAAEGASLVVVGSRGRGGFAQLLLGSVSRSVVNGAAGPVVVVPPPLRSHAAAG